MNILFVSSLTRVATANYIVSALRRAGHALLVASDVPRAGVDVICGADPDVAKCCAARGFVPDLALFIEGGTMQLLPTGLEALPCPTAWYAIDTHMDYAKHLVLSHLFDVTFVAQKQFIPQLARDGAGALQWLPLAFPSEHLAREPMERTIDIAFVGSVDPGVHPERGRLLDALSSIAKTRAIGAAEPAEMLARYARAKVVFNQSASNDINMRYFEAMGCGAALLTDAVVGNGCEELFQPGRHLVQYTGTDDMITKFKALLADPLRRAEIGRAAQEVVLGGHTYDHRAQAIVDRMSGLAKSVRPQPAAYFAAFAALNMGAAALRAAANEFARMGPGSRLARLNRAVATMLRGLAALMRVTTAAARLVKRR